MTPIKTTLPAVFRKTKNVQLAAALLMAISFSNHVHAQGGSNSSWGENTLNIGGHDNVVLGLESLRDGGSPTTGNNNAVVGRGAVNKNTTGSDNAAVGTWCLFYNTTGSRNSVSGTRALFNNTTGRDNIANGHNTLYANTTGSYNTASGSYTLNKCVTANYNSGYGYQVFQGTTANNNTAMGFRAAYSNTTGNDNTSLGYGALYYNITGAGNTALGSLADVSTGALYNATAIGQGTVVNASNKVRIGNASTTVVEGQVPYTDVSDGRFKENIKEEDVKGLVFINKLRPVVYNLNAKKLTEFWTKNMPDSIRERYLSQDFSAATNMRQSGLIAQEVEQAAKEANYNFNGVHVPESENDNYGLAYSTFVVPLVKGMQEQQKMIQSQMEMIEKLQQQVNELQKAKASGSGIDQFSAADASMEQNIPNPFARETVVKFNLPAQIGNAYLTVYDLVGKQLKTLPIHQRGSASITITSDQLGAGMYIYSIIADGKLVDSKRMVLMDK